MPRVFWLTVLVALLAVVGGPTGVSAGGPDSFAVTKGEDTLDESCTPEDCSLRDAIFEAEEDPTLSTITLPAGTFVIASNDPDFGDFNIDTEVVIQGAGMNDSIIDGQLMSTVFSVTAEGKLTLRDLTVTKGKSNANAGGIFSLNELTLERVMVSVNEGDTAGGVLASNLTMNASFIESNTGRSVGGLFVLDATIRDSFIVANTATGSGNQAVGGMLSTGTVSITDSGINSNDATGTIGAAGWQSGFPVTGTTAVPQGFGGPSIVTALRVEVDDNTWFTQATPIGSPQGGIGVNQTAQGGWLNNGAMSATDLDVSGNTAEGNAGGGIFSSSEETVTINRATFNSNSTTGTAAGGAAFSGPADLTNVTVSNNQSEGFAPGLAMITGSITGSTIADNISTVEVFAAGLIADEQVTIEGSIVSGNEPMNCINVIGSVVVPTSLGYNIDDRESCDFESVGDMSNTDPMLGALHDAGGDVGNMRNLPEDSPAIDAWLEGCPPPNVDGRQQGRPSGGACDIGAFERELLLPPTLREWGDINCSSGVEAIVDGMMLLVFLAEVDFSVPEGSSVPCPDVGQTISVQSFPNATSWGDLDCDGQITGTDPLRVFQYEAGIEISIGDCPDMGQEVTVE
jgi:CSLREA domain-containing protein